MALSSYDISTQELSDLQLNVLICEDRESLKNNISIRFIVFMGYPEIFGTLERTWTFAEIYQENKKYIQVLYEKSPETPTNCKMIQEDGRAYVLLYGGTTMYSPRPLFISFWELSEGELMPGELTNCIGSIEEGSVQNYENILIFEGRQKQWYFEEAELDSTDNLLLYIKLDTKIGLTVIFKDGKFIVQKR